MYLLSIIDKNTMTLDKNKFSLDSICYTYRHNFGLLSQEKQHNIRNKFEQIYIHYIEPLLEYIENLEDIQSETLKTNIKVFSLLNTSS